MKATTGVLEAFAARREVTSGSARLLGIGWHQHALAS